MTIEETLRELEKPSGNMSRWDLNALIDQCRSWQQMERFICRQKQGQSMFEAAAEAISTARRLQVEKERATSFAATLYCALQEVGCLDHDGCDDEQGLCCVCVALSKSL